MPSPSLALRHWLATAALLAAAGCFPTLTGAPCSSDDECPKDQLCVSGSCSLTAAPDAGSSADAGATDAGTADAGLSDAGLSDAGLSDAGTDAGPADAGPMDAGQPDAGYDAGPSDAGPVDAGPVDAGPEDAGTADAGHPDSGEADAGPTDAGHADAGEPDSGSVDAGHCPAKGTTRNTGCSTLGATVCDPVDFSVLTCTKGLITGGCEEWISSSCILSGLVCVDDAGSATCQCPAPSDNEIWVDADAGNKGGVPPTGSKNPEACRFNTITQGLAAVPTDGGKVVVTGNPGVPPLWRSQTSYPLDSTATPTFPIGRQFIALNPGVSGSAEPKWPTDGGLVLDGAADGGIYWHDNGPLYPVAFVDETFPLSIPPNSSLYSDGCEPGASNATACNRQAWVVGLSGNQAAVVLGASSALSGFTLAPASNPAPAIAVGCSSGTVTLNGDILAGTTSAAAGQIATGISVGDGCSLQADSLVVGGFVTGVTVNSLTGGASIQGSVIFGSGSDGVDVDSAGAFTLDTSDVFLNQGIGVFLGASQGPVTATLSGVSVYANANYGIQVGNPSTSSAITATIGSSDVSQNGAASNPQAGIYLDTSVVQLVFTGNAVHGNPGAQVYFETADASSDAGWSVANSACDSSSNRFYCYDGGLGVANSSPAVTVNAQYDFWQAKVPLAGPQPGVDYSLGVNAGNTCGTFDAGPGGIVCP